MQSLTRVAFWIAIVLACGGEASATYHRDEGAKVAAIIARSKQTRTAYSVFYWNVLPSGSPREEWSAEFNLGTVHRVETPRDRVVAECAKRSGTHRSVATGEVVRGAQIAGVACGINTNLPFQAMEYLGHVVTRFGVADRVRLTDAEKVRTYDISSDGLILRIIFETNDARRLMLLDLETVTVVRQPPDRAMFDDASLNRSFVPARFRGAPAARR